MKRQLVLVPFRNPLYQPPLSISAARLALYRNHRRLKAREPIRT